MKRRRLDPEMPESFLLA